MFRLRKVRVQTDMRYLITQTLLSSWNYLFSCREESKDDAYADFMDTLNCTPKLTTPEMQNGIDFENLVYSIANGTFKVPFAPTGETATVMGDTVIMESGKLPKWYNGAKAVATLITGAPVQVKAQREVSIAGMDLLVYGVLDALKAATIFDVKFSNKGFGSAELAGKYLESPQHPTYLFLIPDAIKFTYLVSDGEDIYTETYTRRNTRPFEEIAKEFLDSLRDMKLLEVYKSKWAAR